MERRSVYAQNIKLKNLSPSELDLEVCRYLTFPKFISLLTYQALWFSKLNILQDNFEGTLPDRTKSLMVSEHQKFKKHFPIDLHEQIDQMADHNVQDGRELHVVNCWFLGGQESERMWKEYATISEGVLIKSTIRKLTSYVFAGPDYSQIGKVQYVELSQHEMSLYEGNQACERAFLKSMTYEHENELRILTMLFKHPYCVNMEGRPYTPEECSGKNMNNFENPGLYVGVNFEKLIDVIILAPKSPAWLEKVIVKILQMSKLNIPVQKSQLS